MSEIKDGGPAFPRPASTDEHSLPCNVYQDQMGMPLRDYFAIRIAGGLAAFSGTQGSSYGPDDIVTRSYEIADAMIAQRGKGGAS